MNANTSEPAANYPGYRFGRRIRTAAELRSARRQQATVGTLLLLTAIAGADVSLALFAPTLVEDVRGRTAGVAAQGVGDVMRFGGAVAEVVHPRRQREVGDDALAFMGGTNTKALDWFHLMSAAAGLMRWLYLCGAAAVAAGLVRLLNGQPSRAWFMTGLVSSGVAGMASMIFELSHG